MTTHRPQPETPPETQLADLVQAGPPRPRDAVQRADLFFLASEDLERIERLLNI